MYRIYYIQNNYMFRHFTFAIFRLRNEKLSKQLYATYVGCIQWGGQCEVPKHVVVLYVINSLHISTII